MTNIIIGGAWPYANGPLHIGHIAALLPGDVLARYFRARGDNVFYVSGSDCHGTPITLRARAEGTTPEAVSERWHAEFRRVFDKLGFSYDLYTQTSAPAHKRFVQDFHRRLYEGGYVEERTVKQARCPRCEKALADRLVVGVCPRCGTEARGDQCDACGEVLEADALREPRCAECGAPVVFGETTQLFLCISRLRDELNAYVDAHPYWRRNAVAFTRRYIDEGLRDRAITRDLDWGIEVPRPGYEDKRIYIWAENVLGYLSATEELCRRKGLELADVYGRDADSRSYYVHGKDNIPFHTIILPALLLAHGGDWRLPDDIISSEYLTLEGQKISTSRNWAIWAADLAEQYDPDAIRYFFLANGPEKRDADFSRREFKAQVNAELVGVWGNFVNRTLAFVARYLDNQLPRAELDGEVAETVRLLFRDAGDAIARGALRDALGQIFEGVRFANRYYDANRPWKTRTEDPEQCRRTLANCVWLVANFAVLLGPFLPFSSAKVCAWLGVGERWTPQDVSARALPKDLGVLFARIA